MMEIIRVLAEADRYKEYSSFHFVYTLDFRGRVNARSSLLTPQGTDIQKAMLRFSKGERLGKRGMYWLAVHGSGVWGEDKMSFGDRAAFINDENFTRQVRAVVADPLGNKMWLRAKKPWQFLSWADEWARLQDWIESGKSPKDFISHIPVHLDGKCSGTQHYSAMLRDSVGGAAVDLVPSPVPNDIYNNVADVATARLKEETREKFKKFARAWLDIGVTRDMCKPSVMTITYGSSRMTCRKSIVVYLHDLQDDEDKVARSEEREARKAHPFSLESNSELDQKAAVNHMTNMLWDSIGAVVIAALAGMKFIRGVAVIYAKKGEMLEWPTPSGFIAQQKIYETKSRRVKTQLMGTTYMTLREKTEDIDVNRMKASSAPNFVHSMDASHLHLVTAAYGGSGRRSIAVNHDSFGTHASHIEELQSCLKNEFVEMYLQHDVLQEFLDANERRTGIVCDGIEMPEKGDLDLNVIRDSDYCFS